MRLVGTRNQKWPHDHIVSFYQGVPSVQRPL